MANSAHEMIIKMKDFDATSDIHYKEPRLNQRGGKAISIVNGDGNKLVIQVPLTFTWGAQENIDEASGRRSYHMNYQFEKETPAFEKLRAFEERVMADAVTNAKKWFGNAKMTPEVLSALFYPVLKYPKDKVTQEINYDRNPTFKVKLPYWEEKFALELYDMDNQLIHGRDSDHVNFDMIDAMPPKSHVSCLMECGGVWFAGGRCGVTWKFIQGKVRKPVKLEGFCMLDDTDDEEAAEMLDSVDAVANETLATGAEAAEIDNTEEHDQVDEPQEKKKKKRTVKKASAN